jgi:hypothetical protein
MRIADISLIFDVYLVTFSSSDLLVVFDRCLGTLTATRDV